LLSGSEALARALVAGRVRRAWSFPGGPLTRLELLLQDSAPKSGLEHRFTVNEHVAASLALGGALLAGHATCVLLRPAGVPVALDTLGTFGLLNELRSGCLMIEGLDPVPEKSQSAQDHRATLASLAHLVQLEPAAPDELYHLARIALVASLRTGMMVNLRVGARGLDQTAAVQELPPELQPEGPIFSRSAGPFLCTAETHRYHAEKRARRLQQWQPLLEALASSSDGEGTRGVVVAGHLGPRAQARCAARRLPSLRLPAAWPLPRRTLLEFLRGRTSVLVLEEGEPFLEHALQAFCHREGLGCTVSAVGGPRPVSFDDQRLEQELTRFGGRPRAELEVPVRPLNVWRKAYELAAAIGADDGEPWPLYVARMSGEMQTFSRKDPRRGLLKALRALERPTVIVTDPASGGTLDVKLPLGSAAPMAGALSEASAMEERPGDGAPLAIAVIGDRPYHHSELNGILDNAIARRDLLHVLVIQRRSEGTAGPKTPRLGDEELEAQLRSAGLDVTNAQLDDPGLPSAVAYAASNSGPRALVLYANTDPVGDGDSDA
jgi:TPP-dependent indolepyruvate ferredoxin oxidoreductase alpha subunit